MPHLHRLPAVVVVIAVVGLSQAGAQTQAASGSETQMVNSEGAERVTIPGPLRSFERMAGISQKVSSDEILPLLTRNVYVQGYIGWQEHGRAADILLFFGAYVNQARELSTQAGADVTSQIPDCPLAEA